MVYKEPPDIKQPCKPRCECNDVKSPNPQDHASSRGRAPLASSKDKSQSCAVVSGRAA